MALAHKPSGHQKALLEVSLADLPRLEDLPRMGGRLGAVDPAGAERLQAGWQGWMRRLFDGINRALGEERARVDELRRRQQA